MLRRVGLLVLGVTVAFLGLASGRASGAGTTTTTATGTTTTTPASSYAPLATSSLPAGCVGAGAAAVVSPSNAVTALGTPASNLGPSGYPASASVVAFAASSASGSTCRSAEVTVASVSLFDGAVTASSVAATDGRGTVSGLAIDGTAVSATPGQTTAVESWGLLMLGASVGRLSAPLVLRLLQAHDGLSGGTTIVVAFAAAPQPVAGAKTKRHSSPGTGSGRTASASSHGQAEGASTKQGEPQPQKPPPDFPRVPDPLRGGDALAAAAQGNPVVSTAMQYLGIPYQWGGASPKTGFDCSGLVTYVFAQLGVSLPHYAAAQWYSPDAVWIPPNRLKPGDLVFFTGSDGTRKEPGHVGIYVGDGYIIDAPHTGAFVQVDSLDARWFANNYVGAKRIASQLLDRRRLSHTSKPGASAMAIRAGFPLRIPIEPLGESLGFGPASRPASRGDWSWAGAGLGGLLLLLFSACVTAPRRQSPDAVSGSEAAH